MSKQYARAGGWRIDLDQVPVAIKIFNDTLQDIKALTMQAADARGIRPMGDDDVSKALAKEVSERHLDGRGAIWAAEQLSTELTKVVTALEATRQHYRRLESANRHTVSR
ncbi:PE domain-containing protein [Allokutzneria albata]|uniref:PE family protein n=1 Tax=Allokutzneria albata TaxID=211114 RepID=A0A1G9X2B4_ALLAB|nr:PE domain-containing protein [Allokutzneria albata]SDM90869.1 PE family protein [Allokutzneria albata]